MNNLIEQEIRFSAPPELVYQALTDPEMHSAFTGSPATGQVQVGGEFSAWDGYIQGHFLELQPGQRLVWSWTTSHWPAQAPPSRVEIQLTAQNGETLLRMVHSQVPPEQAEDYRQGWIDYYWTPLAQWLTTRSSQPT